MADLRHLEDSRVVQDRFPDFADLMSFPWRAARVASSIAIGSVIGYRRPGSQAECHASPSGVDWASHSENMTRMRNVLNQFKMALAGAAVVALSGCVPIDPYALVSCPTIGVLAEASEITQFRHGGGREAADVTWHGEITTVDFTCIQPEGKGVVIADAIIVATFTRGPAATGDRQFFTLFSTLTERQDRIVDKAVFSLDVKFREGERTVTRTKRIKSIRIPTEGKVAPELYNVYFGFQLSPAEVAYNRTKERD